MNDCQNIVFSRVVSVECFGAGIAHSVERPTEKPGDTLTRVRVPGAARNFLPVNFQCRLSYGVRTVPVARLCCMRTVAVPVARLCCMRTVAVPVARLCCMRTVAVSVARLCLLRTVAVSVARLCRLRTLAINGCVV